MVVNPSSSTPDANQAGRSTPVFSKSAGPGTVKSLRNMFAGLACETNADVVVDPPKLLKFKLNQNLKLLNGLIFRNFRS